MKNPRFPVWIAFGMMTLLLATPAAAARPLYDFDGYHANARAWFHLRADVHVSGPVEAGASVEEERSVQAEARIPRIEVELPEHEPQPTPPAPESPEHEETNRSEARQRILGLLPPQPQPSEHRFEERWRELCERHPACRSFESICHGDWNGSLERCRERLVHPRPQCRGHATAAPSANVTIEAQVSRDDLHASAEVDVKACGRSLKAQVRTSTTL